ncbi:MAG: glycogen/starch/alpha-glucan phosphorylase [Clostridia bacterium]|nr:glycogen/starch/alpha-glucan phosphorylase [Clostridia bacterium]
MKSQTITAAELNRRINDNLLRYYGTDPNNADLEQIYKCAITVARDEAVRKRRAFEKEVEEKDGKQVYYMCMEFLLGRSLKNCVFSLFGEDIFAEALKEYNLRPIDLYRLEPDAGLGNGGLGRLAACFMESMASGNYLATGHSICYELGMFKQKIVDGWQMELTDNWLPMGEVWLSPRLDEAVDVPLGGHIEESWENGRLVVHHYNADVIRATPYDLMIPGHDTTGVSRLRLWKATAKNPVDMNLFSQGDYIRAAEENTNAEMISKILYPPDNHLQGKSLRLRQQYFLVSAALQNIIKTHLAKFGNLKTLPEKAVIHINDTHPSLCIPELMRIFIDECGYGWDESWDIVCRTINYTNHTVMSEALETWSEATFQAILPRIHSIVKEINRRFCDEMFQKTNGDWDKISRMAILANSSVRMANLSVIGSGKVNGVSALHSQILKDRVFKDFNDVYPGKFTNVTNGIDHRRWLCQSNPGLTDLLKECIGDGFIRDASKMIDFLKYKDDAQVLEQLAKIKRENKERFAKFLKREGCTVLPDPDLMLDVQVKRLHEYKRQLLNAMHILSLYLDLKDNPDMEFTPKTFLFAAKAASGYYMAKRIIMFISSIAKMINSDPAVNQKLRVIFAENYRVTMAEYLMPAADVSEQISQAGTEASGTGNMKLMINGALTVGTLDGANVEIHREVGDENIFLFGLRTEEVADLYRRGYRPLDYYNSNSRIRRIIDTMRSGIGGESFADLADSLTMDSRFSDPYMNLADFESYRQIQSVIGSEYATDKTSWNRKSLVNIAKAGFFSSDRSIRDYAQDIWNVKPLEETK